jgi:ribose transport system permease protein
MKLKTVGKNILMSLIIPAVVYVFFIVLCNATGASRIRRRKRSADDHVHFHLLRPDRACHVDQPEPPGRFDFSVGATLVLAIILGGNIAKEYKLGAAGLLLLTVLFGAIIGLISGLVYVLLALPPMVVSLGAGHDLRSHRVHV